MVIRNEQPARAMACLWRAGPYMQPMESLVPRWFEPASAGSCRRLGVRVAVLVSFAACACLVPAHAQTRDLADTGKNSQRLRLVAALAGDTDSLVRLKAVRELGALDRLDGRCVQALIGVLDGHRWLSCVGRQGAIALSRAGSAAVPAILDALRTRELHDYDYRAWYLLMALGRMGRSGAEAAPLLRRLAANPNTGQQRAGQIRVVLASIGQASLADIDSICAQIRARTPSGTAAADMMGFVATRHWATEAVIDALMQCIDGRVVDHITEDAVIALGALGNQARTAVGPLRAMLSDLPPNAHLRIMCAIALSRIQGQRGADVLPAELKFIASESWVNREPSIILYFLADTLIDSDMIGILTALLDHPDPQVVEGAAHLVAIAGMGTRSTDQRLIAIFDRLRSSRNMAHSTLRLRIAEGLGLRGSAAEIVVLRQMLEKEPPNSVRRTLKEAIRAAQLGAPGRRGHRQDH